MRGAISGSGFHARRFAITFGTTSARRRRRSMTWSRPSCAISDVPCGDSGSDWGSRDPQGRRERRLRRRRVVAAMVLLAGAALVLLPSAAYAWTPGTHVFLGEAVMR